MFSTVDAVSFLFESDISWLVEDLVSPGLMVSNGREQITLRYYFAAELINEMVESKSLIYSYENGKLTHNLSKDDLVAINDLMFNFMIQTEAYKNQGDY